MSNNELKTFVDHLEFLGYEFEKGEDSTYYWGKHEKYGPIWVGKPSEKAPLGLRSFWSLDKTKIDQDKLLYFELINRVNRECRVSTYIGDDDSILVIAIYAGLYEKIDFGAFVDAFHSDSAIIYSHKDFEKFFDNK